MLNFSLSRSEPLASSTPHKSCSHHHSHQPSSTAKSAGSDSKAGGAGKLSTAAASTCSSGTSRKPSSQTPTTAESPYKTSDFYIIRVSIESGGPATEGVIMYKSIMVSNHEKTGSVIRSAMMKHGLEGSPDNYTLSQLLPDKGKFSWLNSTFALRIFILPPKKSIDFPRKV